MVIDISVPVVSNTLVRDVENPRIRVHEPELTGLTSNYRFAVDLLDAEGEVARKITVVGRVKQYATVAVAAADIRRGEPIGNGGFVLEETVVTGIDGYFCDAGSLAGRQMKRSVRAGMVLTERNTEPIPIISRGDKIIMKACIGSVLVTAEGVAREDGGLNEIIRVYIQTTKKTIEGRVVDNKTVRIGGQGG